MELVVREAKLSDLDDIVEMWRELSVDQLGKDQFYKGSLEFKSGERQIEQSIISEKCGLFVAECDGEIQGFIEAWTDRNEFKLNHNNNYAYIVHYYIRPEGRNMKNIIAIIFRLYRVAEEWAILKGKDYVISDAFEHNTRIVRFLKKVGVSKYKTRMVREI